MKLREIKTKNRHFFLDEQDRIQDEHYMWWDDGQLRLVCHFRDGELHGEFKDWGSSGKLIDHIFNINNKEIVDFLKNPELYPTTPEEKTMFVLMYGSAQFIGDTNETN